MPNKKGPYKMDVPAEKLDYIQSSSAPSRMNSYDKDMMHERELIYDAKKQEKTGSKKTKKHDKELIYDAKGQIHNEDVAKKKNQHVVSRIAGSRSRG